MSIVFDYLTNPKLWIGLFAAVCLAGTHYAAWDYGRLLGEVELSAYKRTQAEAAEKATKEAVAREREMTQRFVKAERTRHEALQTISDRYNSALDELRSRPERASSQDPSAAACEGATGAGLSRPDAEFLEGEAAGAARLQTALSSCYKQLDLFEELNK